MAGISKLSSSLAKTLVTITEVYFNALFQYSNGFYNTRCAFGGAGGFGAAGGEPGELDASQATGGDRGAHRAQHLALQALGGVAEKGGFASKRPRHTLRGRQDAEAVERSGVRLKLLKQQALAGDIVLLFADESEALTHPYLARARARRGAGLGVEAPGQARKVAMIGALDFAARELIVETSRSKRSGGVIALIERLDRLYGPKPGEERKPVRIVLDNGPVHTSKATLAALGQRSHWLAPEWLPKYAPELNDIERSWKTLKSQRLAHQTFQGADHLETAINKEISIMNANRKSHPLAKLRISA